MKRRLITLPSCLQVDLCLPDCILRVERRPVEVTSKFALALLTPVRMLLAELCELRLRIKTQAFGGFHIMIDSLYRLLSVPLQHLFHLACILGTILFVRFFRTIPRTAHPASLS
mmetsp:Transcript_53246/g.105893  ORF Transcript_53246/g.105893 Transcript_53246/m.105893 type:complete len:114 (-) Transcript_53246:158-499(-)